MMNDEYTATPEQHLQWVQAALIHDGFEQMPISCDSYFKEVRENVYIIVDLADGKHDISFLAFGNRIDNDKDGMLERVGTLIAEAMTGAMPSKKEPDEIIKRPEDVPDEVPDEAPSKPVVFSAGYISPRPSDMSELSIDIIKKYINDKVTDEEAYVFLQLCQARRLNPFLKQAYLIKYDHTTPASMVVGKDAFLERAEMHGQFDGFKAGIITDTAPEREGTYINADEILLGGWAKVYRKDRGYPVHITVSMTEYDTGKSSWKRMPATMIRKVALVQGLRESFPSELSGMYDHSEMGVEVQA